MGYGLANQVWSVGLALADTHHTMNKLVNRWAGQGQDVLTPTSLDPASTQSVMATKMAPCMVQAYFLVVAGIA